MHAVARLALHPLIPNIQASWVKLGPDGAAACLRAGANDLGGTLMNESITRAAGAAHGQEMPPEPMEALIRSLGRTPRQRTTLYGEAPAERAAASFDAPHRSPRPSTRRRAATSASRAGALWRRVRIAGFVLAAPVRILQDSCSSRVPSVLRPASARGLRWARMGMDGLAGVRAAGHAGGAPRSRSRQDPCGSRVPSAC